MGDLQAAGYSQLLNIVVRNLCEVDPERRSTCSELFRWLKPYEESIINLERFEVSNLPSKIASLNVSQGQSVNNSPQRAMNIESYERAPAYTQPPPPPQFKNEEQVVRTTVEYRNVNQVPPPQYYAPISQEQTYVKQEAPRTYSYNETVITNHGQPQRASEAPRSNM